MGRYIGAYADAFDGNGDPRAGAKLYFYRSNTTTPLDTFSDVKLRTPNTNPVVADAAGRWPTIFLSPVPYKVVLKDSNDVTIWTADPVLDGSGAGSGLIITPQDFGAAGDGSGDDTEAIQQAYDFAVDQLAAGAGVLVQLVGKYRITGSIVVNGATTTLMSATLIFGPGASFNRVMMWNGEPSTVGTVFDLKRSQNAEFAGRIRIEAESGAGAGVTAIGSSSNIWSSPKSGGSYSVPNVDGQGGSNTRWDTVRTQGVDYGLYTPGSGLSVPSNLVGNDLNQYGTSFWQASPRQRDGGILWLPLVYQVDDIITDDSRVFKCKVSGTPTQVPPVNTLAMTVGNLEYIADKVIEAADEWTPNSQIDAGAYVYFGTNTYLAKVTISNSGVTPPTHVGSTTTEASVTAWASGQTPAAGDYRSNSGNRYYLVAVGTPSTTGAGPTHTTETPVADANGYTWAYAGPDISPQWQYLRPTTYSAAGVGLSVQKLFCRDGITAVFSSSVSTDDSWWGNIRHMEARGPIFNNNGGYIVFGVVFGSASAICARYKNSSGGTDLNNDGQIAISNFGTLLGGTVYIDGEWNRGILLGHESTTRFKFKPDGFHKTATGVVIETHPRATRMQADITVGAEVLAAAVSNDILLVNSLSGGSNFADGATLTWAGGSALILSSVIIAASGAPQATIIYRLISGSKPGAGVTVTAGAVSGTVAANSLTTTIANGIVGVNEIADLPVFSGGVVIRQIKLWTYSLLRSVVPYRINRTTTTTTFDSRDSFLVKCGDLPHDLNYKFVNGLLRQMMPGGLHTETTALTALQTVAVENGARQIFQLSGGGQLALPTRSGSSPGLSPDGWNISFRLENPGLATGGNPFFVDASHPAITWRGIPPVFPDGSRHEYHVWCVDGTTVNGWATPFVTPVALTYAASFTPNLQKFKNGTLTLTGNITVNAPSNAVAGQEGWIEITQDGTGSRVATWNSAYKFAGGAAVGGVLSTTANAVDILVYRVISASVIHCSLVKDSKA